MSQTTELPPYPMQTTVTVQPQMITPFGPVPKLCQCPSCHANILSNIRYEASNKTHIAAAIVCFFTCCGCIPYLIDSCKSSNHYCPNCGAYLGTYGDRC